MNWILINKKSTNYLKIGINYPKNFNILQLLYFFGIQQFRFELHIFSALMLVIQQNN